MILIGFNARLFPTNWRPIMDEIAFAAANGFQSIQLISQEEGLNSEILREEIAAVGDALQAASITPVMEMNLIMHANGLTVNGVHPMDVVRANLSTIVRLGITSLHWHCKPLDRTMPEADLHALEKRLTPQMHEAVELAAQHHFRFAFEHNAPDLRLFTHPDDCALMLDTVPGLGFVWDFNHTHPDHREGFKALAPHVTLLHVSDATLPETNAHLPLGLGTIDMADYCQIAKEAGYTGAAILEIGSLSAEGFRQDTDAALLDSREKLAAAWG